MILAIDPGNTHSAYCFIDKDYKPKSFGKVCNHELMEIIYKTDTVIEMVESYGMPVGKEVFDTVLWIGRMIQKIGEENVTLIGRKKVKVNLCNSVRAKDSNVRQALMDRFGDKGTAQAPGWFYGFKADIWSAYAIGVTYLDIEEELNG